MKTTANSATSATVQVLTSEQISKVAATMIAKYQSIRAVKENCYKGFCTQYGKDTAKQIIKTAQGMVRSLIDSKADTAWSNVSAANILRTAYKDLTKGGQNSQFAWIRKAIEAGQYADVLDFISRCYPNTIDGQPAVKVTYIDTEQKCIFDCYELLTITPDNAVSILHRAHKNQAKAAKSRFIYGKVVCTTTEQKNRHEVARFNIVKNTQDGTLTKGDCIEIDYSYPVVRADEYIKLTEMNTAIRKVNKAAQATK